MHVFASHQHRSHHAYELQRGKLALSTESPDRAERIRDALKNAGHALSKPDELDHDLLQRVHDAKYLEFLSSAWRRWAAEVDADAPAMAISWPERGRNVIRPENIVGQLGYHSFGADCSIVDGTWEAAMAAASLAHSATNAVITGAHVAYALCRPPGHHATKDQFGGYCYLNNSAIAAQRLRDAGNKRVAVLDVDYHHGNGTQAIFYDRADVLTISIHADPTHEFPWFTGHAAESGSGDGVGHNLNYPLSKGSSFDAFRTALILAVEHIVATDVEALVIALGVDAYVDDPLGTFTITTEDFAKMGAIISECHLPTVIVQEGGYATDALGTNVAAFLSAF